MYQSEQCSVCEQASGTALGVKVTFADPPEWVRLFLLISSLLALP